MSQFKIHDDHDTTPASLESLSAPLFADFGGDAESVATKWTEAMQEFDSSRNWVNIGLPTVEITFYRLSRAEFAYLSANFGGETSIRCLNQQLNSYGLYNCTMKPLKAGDDKAGKWTLDNVLPQWSEVTLTFIDLIEQ